VQQPGLLVAREPLTGSPFGSVNSPDAKPWQRGLPSNGPPPAHGVAEPVVERADPVPAMLAWVAWTNRASPATSPKFQPSPYR
jgi:hypothetical protein